MEIGHYDRCQVRTHPEIFAWDGTILDVDDTREREGATVVPRKREGSGDICAVDEADGILLAGEERGIGSIAVLGCVCGY